MSNDALNLPVKARDRAPACVVSDAEVSLLNFYRASALHGGLILGQMARRSCEPELIARLTRHSAEEMLHSLWWTETIARLSGCTKAVTDTYHSRCVEIVGTPISLLEVIALTSVFEHRICECLQLHLNEPDVHPIVVATLRRVLADERWHLRWIGEWLMEERKINAQKVSSAVGRYAIADREICEALSAAYGLRKSA